MRLIERTSTYRTAIPNARPSHSPSTPDLISMMRTARHCHPMAALGFPFENDCFPQETIRERSECRLRPNVAPRIPSSPSTCRCIFPWQESLRIQGSGWLENTLQNTDVGPKSRSYSAHRPFLEFESDHRVCPSQLVFYPLHRYQ